MTTQPPSPPKKKNFLLSPVGLVIGLLLVCGCVGSVLTNRAGQQAVTGTAPTTVGAPTVVGTEPTAAEAEPTDGPTATPAPTNTAEPTPTEAPTETPAPTFTPTPPQEFSGSGGSVETLTIEAPSTLVFTHQGSRNFAVIAYPKEGMQELLVNTIGNYEGTRWLAPGEYSLEITADGDWSVRVEALTRDDTAIGPLEGQGDFVSPIFAADGRGAYSFMHDGERNFAVLVICDSGRDLAVNEIGPVESEAIVEFNGVGCFWDVSADGSWSITPK